MATRTRRAKTRRQVWSNPRQTALKCNSMTIKEFITKLTQLQIIHGSDVEVWTTGDDYGFTETESVRFITADQLPTRIGHPIILIDP